MRTVSFLVLPLLTLSAPLFAQTHELYALETVTKQLIKDSATSAAPASAVDGAKAATGSLDKAKTLKETTEGAPGAMQEQAQEAAKEAAKEKAKEAVPEEAKQGVKAAEHGVKSAKDLKKGVDAVPKSTGAATEVAKDKAKEEATNKMLDMMH